MKEMFKLNDAGTHIVQQSEMKEPIKKDFFIYGNFHQATYESELNAYNKHIASLKTYPISGIVPPEWKDRDIDASEFELKKGLFSSRPGEFHLEVVAIPIVQPKEESQQDNRINVCEMIAKDMKDDATNFDGKPFNGKVVAEYFGNHGAAISALADLLKSLIQERININK